VSSRKPPSNSDDWDDFDIPTWDDTAGNVPTRNSTPSSQRSSSRRPYPDPLYDNFETPPPPSRQPSRTPASSQPPARLSSRVPTRTTRPSQDPYRDPYADVEEEYAGEPYYPEAPDYGAPRAQGTAASQYDLYAEPTYDPGWEAAAAYQEVSAPRRRPRQRSRPARPSIGIARPAISDRGMAGIVGAAVLGLLVMIGVVWYGIGDLSTPIPWHLNASGDVDEWVSRSGLWRVPFGVFMSLAIGLALGAFLWKRDRFAARFIIASMCVLQVLAWVAVVDQLW
jgi:hypothetical protein